MLDFTFGDRVSVSQKYKRVTKHIDHGKDYRLWRMWKPEEYKKTNCIFLGFRRLSNGVVEEDYEYGNTFNPKEHFKAALVCADEKSKPVYVPIESMLLWGVYGKDMVTGELVSQK